MRIRSRVYPLRPPELRRVGVVNDAIHDSLHVNLDRDPKTGYFLPGRQKTGGRGRGARNQLGEQFLEDLQDEWERRGKEVLRELSALELAKVMRIVTRPFVSRLAGSISEVEGSLPEDLEGLVERARLEHGQKAAAIMRRYIKEVCNQQGGE